MKGGFVNIERKFLRVMSLTKITVMLAFTIVGYNIDRIRSFIARKAEEKPDGAKAKRAKHRRGTWADVLDTDLSASGPDPPPG